MKLVVRHHHLAIILILNLLAIIGLSWLFVARAGLVTEMRQSVIDQSQVYARQERLSQLRDLVVNTGLDRAQLSQHFVSTLTVPQFIESLEILANEQQIELDLRNVEATAKPPTLKLNLQLTGSRSGVLAYLRALEKLPYRLRVNTGQLQKREVGEDASESWSGNFGVELLSYQPE
ncbi:MAG: hypothetical protein U9M92_01295 [Patescibacteria group bacterium]|nr:hypothetical protein [Patescibacteria group bacterium]